jgi:xanthine dehydrogenase molybdopterin-binding subunit B
VTEAKLMAGVAAVAAKKFRRAVSATLNRHEDIICTGKRHPVEGKFKVGFKKTGRLEAVSIEAYMNGGHQIGSTVPIAFNAVNNTDCAYDVPIGMVR